MPRQTTVKNYGEFQKRVESDLFAFLVSDRVLYFKCDFGETRACC